MTIRARQRSGTLVGRVGELAELDRGLERVGLGEPPWFVRVVGEPGSGKTRLLRSLVSPPNSAAGWCSTAALPSSSVMPVRPDRPSSLALGVLDELGEADVIRPSEAPRRFRFRHPIVRTVVNEGIPSGWRLGAHARAAAALAADHAPAVAYAHQPCRTVSPGR